jgi:hypothetical protein
MGAVRLDYQRSNRPAPWLGAGVLAVALALLATLGAHYRALTREVAHWEARIEHIEHLSRRRALISRPLSAGDVRAQVLEVGNANKVVRQLSQPWNALFDAVEASGGQGIALLSLEPDLHKGTVVLGGEARDLDALLKYVRQLSRQEVFGGVLLQQHQVRQDDPERPLRFSLLATVKAGAP